MCGIAAICSYDSGVFVSETDLETITRVLNVRGPDGRGKWLNHNKSKGLVHTRLAIIDLDERAAQPMVSDEGVYVLSYNGEIYNFHKLRKQLLDSGEQLKTCSDTEVLLKLYARHGQDMLPMLRGMFALVLIDNKKDEVFFARDPYGIKPLYLHNQAGLITLASQVKAIASLPRVSVEPNAAGMISFGLFGSVQEPHTCYKDIQSVPAGTFGRVLANGDVKITPYCSFIPNVGVRSEPDSANGPVGNATERIKAEFRSSVRDHLVSDVPVGVFLSAGIDSGALLGMASDVVKQSSNEPLGSTTLAFSEFHNTDKDEAPLAQQVAAQYRSRHHVTYVSESDVADASSVFFEAMDQPSIDGLNTWLVSRVACEQGYKVMLSGLGADELLGGYPSFVDVPRLVNMRRYLGANENLGRFATHIIQHLQKLSIAIHPKSAGVFAYGYDFSTAYFLKRCLFLPWELETLFARDFVEAGLGELDWQAILRTTQNNISDSAFIKVSTLENQIYMRNQLLRDTDWAGMSNSIEIRTPFVDYNLFHNISRDIVDLDKNAGDKEAKRLLGESPSIPLSHSQLARPKTGFELPYKNWLGSIDGWQSWRRNRNLVHETCPWPRKWAHNVLEHYFSESTLNTWAAQNQVTA